ncbi:MAG: DUF2796 domain-containing protein [Pseudomonadota bacterium]
MMKVKSSTLQVSALMATTALAESKSLNAHVHGEGHLNIVLDGKNVGMEFHTPAWSLIGFEHKAETAKELEAVQAAIAVLSKPIDLFGIPEEAKCSISTVGAELEREAHEEEKHEKTAHDHDHDHGNEAAEAEHSEFHMNASFLCEDPAGLSTWATKLFDQFPGLEEVDVQVVTPSGQCGFELTKDAPSLELGEMMN